MTDRKPEVWRGIGILWPDGQGICRVEPAPEELCDHTVIKDGTVMPLDAATERLVEAVRMILSEWPENRDGVDWRGLKSARNALAAFDAARKAEK